MDLEEIIDKMIDEKMDCKEYKEVAEKMEDEDLKEMFMKMSEDEHNHYKMIRSYLANYLKED